MEAEMDDQFRQDNLKILEEVDLRTTIRIHTRIRISRNHTKVDIQGQLSRRATRRSKLDICLSYQCRRSVEDHDSVAIYRFLIASIYRVHPRSLHISTDKAARRARFEGAWKIIKQELLDYIAGEDMKEAIEWYERNLNYNVPGSKLNRGMSVVDTAEIIKGTSLTDDEYLKATVLGWGIELFQAFFLISDDMMDSSITRRGQPCWYRVPKVGQIAINDSFMREAAIYHLLKKHFPGETYYADIPGDDDEVDLSKFSLKKHSLIVIYKTAYYYYLPVALAMYIVHVPQSYPSRTQPIEPYALAKYILIPLGEYFQIQDDYLDLSGTPEQISTDILDNKYSWSVYT
ncbi:terpenoid synthase [Armillaria gallica]|uniref:(2E,6E)-farnesyl diphosphate synthase n=1 Tax=Armillaria gallica TaxID=47427 RepID=A0A2H3CZ94_ARMGA|nr:terpenoid synthase [Armillaria gallica]